MRGRLGIGTEWIVDRRDQRHVRHSTRLSRSISRSGREVPPGIVGDVDARGAEARWWGMRPAQSLKPASYVCPFCDGMLHATSEHALIAPEGDVSKRRHAHMECVVAARKRGELPTEDEFRKGSATRGRRR
jgi:hypothetical protein